MALWQRLSTCNVNTVSRIQDLYAQNVISILLRHNLAEYIEHIPWGRYNVEDPSHHRDIQTEFHNFMMAVKCKIDELRRSGDMEKIMDTSKRLEEQYSVILKNFGNKPHEFVTNMQRLLDEENKILARDEDQEVKPQLENDAAMLSDLQHCSIFSHSFRQIKELRTEIDKQIKALDERSDFKRLTQEELHRKTTEYQARISQMSDIEQKNFNQLRERSMRGLHAMHQQINEVMVRLLTLFDEIMQRIRTAHGCILKDIDDWKEVQRRSMINGEPQSSLDYIERNACMLADALTACTGYYARIRDHLDEITEHRGHMLNWHNDIISLIRVLMAKCFIIEKQPPQVMKKDTRFSASVRIIAGERWGFAIKQPQIKVCLVNAEQVQSILYVMNRSIPDWPDIQVCGEVLNGDKVMEYSSQTKAVQLNFKNLVLKKHARTTDRRAQELVTEEKFGVLFQCMAHLPYTHFTIGDAHMTLHAVSLPVTVTVHGSQSPPAEATIFWDNCFAPPNRESFAHPGAHPWGELKDYISEWFKKNTDRYLNKEALCYLGMKILNTDSAEDLDSKLVTWQGFAKDTLKKPDQQYNFTFWEWLYNCIDLIKKHFLPMWKDNLIEGFISKPRTETLLKATSAEPHTFLLRFSDSKLGMISISYKAPDMSIKNFIYDAKDLSKMDLAQRIMDPPQYKYLYPKIAKETKFAKYHKVVTDVVPGYEKDLIKAHIPLEERLEMDNLLNETDTELMEIYSYFDSY